MASTLNKLAHHTQLTGTFVPLLDLVKSWKIKILSKQMKQVNIVHMVDNVDMVKIVLKPYRFRRHYVTILRLG